MSEAEQMGLPLEPQPEVKLNLWEQSDREKGWTPPEVRERLYVPLEREREPSATGARVTQDVAIDLATNDIYRSWLDYHREHPKVYRAVEALALFAHRQGRRFGVKALYEIARWERRLGFRLEAGEEFKLPNNFTSMYARLLAERHPGLADDFATAELRTAMWPTDPASIRERAEATAEAEQEQGS